MGDDGGLCTQKNYLRIIDKFVNLKIHVKKN